MVSSLLKLKSSSVPLTSEGRILQHTFVLINRLLFFCFFGGLAVEVIVDKRLVGIVSSYILHSVSSCWSQSAVGRGLWRIFLEVCLSGDN